MVESKISTELPVNPVLTEQLQSEPRIIKFKQWLKDNGAVYHKVSQNPAHSFSSNSQWSLERG